MLAGEGGAQLVPRCIRVGRHELRNERLHGLGDELWRAAAMRCGLHRTGLPREAQDAVDGGSPHAKTLGELLVGLLVLGTGFNDAEAKIGGDGCGHAS